MWTLVRSMLRTKVHTTNGFCDGMGAEAEVRRYQIVGIELKIVDRDTPYNFTGLIKPQRAQRTQRERYRER